jgi:hypothetical protein
MFRYISEILSQFSTAQKVIALSLLLFSIVTISIGPSLIGAINLDKTELNAEIDKKDKKINQLEKYLDSKDSLIRYGQQSCTNQIIQREKEFVTMLDALKQKAMLENGSTRIVNQTLVRESSQSDSMLTTSYSPQRNTIIIKNDMKGIMREIDLIKDKVNH